MTMRKKDTKLLKPREAAEILGVKPRTVVKYIRDGTLQGVKINGHSWRVERGDLEKFIASSRVQP